MAHSIVIVGAGPGGVAAARALRQYVDPADRITVIDLQDEQRLGVTLLLIMRGWRTPEEVTIRPSRVLNGIAEFLLAEVKSLDPVSRTIETSMGTVSFDALILAPGAELAPELVPGLSSVLENGMAGHCWSLPAAVQLRERLSCFSGGRVMVIIPRIPYKCPPAPYAAALLVRDLMQERGLAGSVEITVVTPEPSPLAVAGPEIGAKLTALLNAHGIAVETGEQLTAVDPRQREVRFASGKRELFDLLLVVPPHRAPAFVREAGLTEGDWVPANLQTMRTATEGIWAVGDVAAVRVPEGLLVPKAAIFAQQQAEVAARDLASWLGYSAPEPEVRAFGRCWFLTAQDMAGYVEGDFFCEPQPQVILAEPTADNYSTMQTELATWLMQDPGYKQ